MMNKLHVNSGLLPTEPVRRACGSHPRPQLVFAAGALLLFTLALPASAQLPVGPNVVHGSASVRSAGNQMTVTNSPNAILNWQSFSIGSNNGVRFQQQAATSQVLNRVTGNDPSQILGSLSSNGRVWLVNPNGVLFGQNARIDVAGLVASTLNISNADFLANRFNFVAASGPNRGQVLNQGQIRTTFGGRVLLIGEQVRNEGVIQTPGGEIVLAAGKSIELVDSGMPNVIVRVSAPENQAVNLGTLVATGGSVDLHASIVNQEGIVRADSVGMNAAGRVVLKGSHAVMLSDTSQTQAKGGTVQLQADTVNNRGEVSAKNIAVAGKDVLQQGRIGSPGASVTMTAEASTYLDGTVDVSDPSGTGGSIRLNTGKLEGMAGGSLRADGAQGGSIRVEGQGMVGFSSTLSATGTTRGGSIEVTGDSLYLLNATVDASGAQGGMVHLGGGWQGSGDLPHARTVLVGVGSEVKANGAPAAKAAGGEVVVWSKESSEHYGALQAREGGRIEFSSKGEIRQTGSIEAGPGGSVLFDPKNLIITDSPPDTLALARQVVSGSVPSAQPGLVDGNAFGATVALDGDRLAVGANNANAGGSLGAVHLFTGVGEDFSGLTWQKKLASNTGAFGMPPLSDGDFFGTAVALNGDLLVVGANHDPTGGVGRGAVHLFTGVGADFAGLTWRTKLASGTGASGMPDLADGVLFGTSVALDGDRMAVGALRDGAGSVHLLTGVGTDFSGLTWRKTLASEAGAIGMPILAGNDGFGVDVSLDGDRLAVAAFSDSTGGTTRGAVHLFTGVLSTNPDGGVPDFAGLAWSKKLASETGAINMPPLADSDFFGSSVALDGDRLAVGAVFDDTGGTDRGAVHLFTAVGADFSGLTWQGKLASSTGAAGMPALATGEQFGSSVALNGNRLAVGALLDDTGGTDRGAVHLFIDQSSNFSELAWRNKLANGIGTTGMPAAAEDRFGVSVALEGDLLAVGAFRDDTGGTDRGAVHLFTGAGTDFSALTWQKKVASGIGAIGMPSLVDDDRFGRSVALDGGRLAVGAPSDDTGGIDRGAVHLFTGVGADFSNLTWQKKLASGAGAAGMPALVNSDAFGTAVALDGDRLVASAPENSTGFQGAGVVHLFNGVGTDFSVLTWQKTLASGTDGLPPLSVGHGLGISVALQGDLLAVGGDLNNGVGKVYLFNGVGTNFTALTRRATLTTGSGAIDMPVLGTDGDSFGEAIALDGDRLAVGALSDDGGGSSTLNRGAVHLFDGLGTDFSGLTWRTKIGSGPEAAVKLALEDDDNFGASVAMDGNRLAVGARAAAAAGAPNGAVYLFTGLSGLGSTVVVPGEATFENNFSGTSYITPISIATLLQAGTAVTLQANNDITVVSPIAAGGEFVNGDLTLRAGRNVLLNANITTGNGDFTAVAGDPGATAAFRDTGRPTITLGPTTLIVGTGIGTLAAVGGDVLSQGGGLTANRWLIYAEDPATSIHIEGFNKHYDQTFTLNSIPAYASDGSWFFYSVIPTLLVAPSAETMTYGNGLPVFSPIITGFIDGDTTATAGLSGTATWNVDGASSTSGNPTAAVHDVSYIEGLSSSLGYRLADDVASTNRLTVDPKPAFALYTGIGKVYDGTTAAALSAGTLSGVIAGDVVALSPTTAAFRDKNVGTAKPIDAAEPVTSGADASNYTVTLAETPPLRADITPRAILGSITADRKTYDGTTSATILTRTLSGVIGGDNVSYVGGTATFSDKSAAEGKLVTAVDLGLVGTDAVNYNVNTTATAQATIDKLAIIGSITADRKTYDGTTSATILTRTLSGVIGGDNVSYVGGTATFSDKSAAEGKLVTAVDLGLVGTDAVNYNVNTTATAQATIDKLAIIGSITADRKTYDGTTSATILTRTLSGVIGGDNVSYVGGTATFSDKSAAEGKLVTAVDLGLVGTDAVNYNVNTTATAQATIDKLAIIGSITADRKTYDGTTSATILTRTLSGVIGGDNVSYVGGTATFSDKSAAEGKLVTAVDLGLAGTDAVNYNVNTTATASANVDRKVVAATLIGRPSKVYDGTTAALLTPGNVQLIGLVPGDRVEPDVSAGGFDSVEVGANKALTAGSILLTGLDAGNYDPPLIAPRANIGLITPATLTFVADPAIREVGGSVSGLSGSLTGFRAADTLSTATIGTPLWTTPATSASPAGRYPVEGGGLSATNYVFTQAAGNVAALTLQVSDTAQIKQQEAVNTAVASTDNAVVLAQTTAAVAPLMLAPAPVGVVDTTATKTQPEFGAVNLQLMSYDETKKLLESRKEYKKKLFADTIYKLVEDPSLADLRPCPKLADVDSGVCRMTDAQRKELAAKRAQASQAANVGAGAKAGRGGRRAKVATLPQIQRKYIVLFGIDQYADTTIPALENAVRDAEAVGQLFGTKLGYETRIVKNATKADIVRALNRLSTEVDKNDSVVVYYAGHGYLIDETGVGYWLAADAMASDPTSWISTKDVSRMLADIPANQLAMISDSCYSGAFTKEQKVGLTRTGVKAEDVLVRRSVVVMSSGGDEPVADGGRNGHSIFAWHLMQTIGGVDKWEAGTAVFEDVQQKVHRRYPQTPQYGAVSSAGHQAGGDYLFEFRQLDEVR